MIDSSFCGVGTMARVVHSRTAAWFADDPAYSLRGKHSFRRRARSDHPRPRGDRHVSWSNLSLLNEPGQPISPTTANRLSPRTSPLSLH